MTCLSEVTEKIFPGSGQKNKKTVGNDKIIKMNQNILTILILKQLGKCKISENYERKKFSSHGISHKNPFFHS